MTKKSPNTMLDSGSSTKVLLSNRDADELKLTFAGNIVKHLGVQMYAGRPVPAIAELISNAWDADATTVDVNLPLSEAWDPGNQDHFIEVSDNGNGMMWDMIRDAYLDVGRDRREVEGTDKSPGGRLLQGRKGIGKLAGFGIADVVDVQTVRKDTDSGENSLVLIWFRLDLSDLKKAKREPGPVELLFAGPVSKAPKDCRRKKGTTITLKRLHLRKSQNVDRFHRSMAQRFLLIGPQFLVQINGDELQGEDIKLQWRFPENNWETDDVAGCGPVQYWVGFARQPRKQNEGELSGILVYTRGKISQEATFFEISGGATGQHGLRYMVGMVRAEWFDDGAKGDDLIATPRDSLDWGSPQGVAFKTWGQSLVKKYLSKWAKMRTELREKQITELRPELKARIEGLAPVYKDVALRFVDKFKTVEMEPAEFEEILSWFLGALENATLRSILRKLRETDASDLEQLDDLFNKMEVRTAVTLLQIIESNLAAIDALEKMHKEDAKERGILSKHLERNPWLVDPTWMLNKAEGRVATWIFKEFGLPEKGDPGDKDRADFFCTAVGGTLHIVEIKRGAHEATEKDILQADKYRKYVVRRFKELTVPKAIRYHHVQAHLISATLHKDAEGLKQVYADKGWVFFTTWDDLIERASYSHVQFRDALEIQASGITEPTIAVDEHVPSKATDRKRKKTPSSKKGGLKHIKKKKAKKAKKKKK